MNSVNLVGRLTRDPELKKTQTGKSLINFTVAVNREFNREQSDFINCVAWDKTADFIANYLGKGSLVSVKGSVQSRSYEDNTGKKIFVQEVNAERVNSLEPISARENQQYQPQATAYQPQYSNDEEPVLDITSDDLPF